MDWQDFMASLSLRDQAVIECLIEGTKASAMAKKRGVCDSTIQHHKRSLALKIQEFMGCEILIDIQRRPQWKQNLEATKKDGVQIRTLPLILNPAPSSPPAAPWSS